VKRGQEIAFVIAGVGSLEVDGTPAVALKAGNAVTVPPRVIPELLT